MNYVTSFIQIDCAIYKVTAKDFKDFMWIHILSSGIHYEEYGIPESNVGDFLRGSISYSTLKLLEPTTYIPTELVVMIERNPLRQKLNTSQ
jgi:hypothetical protein